MGYPGEDERDHEETLELADELMLDDYFVSIAEPIPGTELGDEVKGLEDDDNPVFMEPSDRKFRSLAEERAFSFMLDSYVFRSMPIPVTDELLRSLQKEARDQQKHIETVTRMLKNEI